MQPFTRTAALLASGLLLAVGGCGNEMLSRNESVRALMAQNRELQDKLLAAEDRIADLKAAGAEPAPRPRPIEDPFRALAIRFGTGTSPVDEDGQPGPERLQVVIEPLDAEGDVVKRAGRLRLEALRPGADGAEPTPHHAWTFTQADLAEMWIGSLGIRGYVMTLGWPDGRPPAGDTLLLRARFTTLGGETLTAEQPVRLAPER